MKTFSFVALLFLFWVFLSGHYTPLLLGLGMASVLLAVFISRRMYGFDHETYPLHLSLKLPGYFLYLIKEIFTSNIDVVKRILRVDGATISPQLVEIPHTQKTNVGAVIYANSITLTPGTVTIRLSDDHLLVHALSEDGVSKLKEGEMSEEISKRVVHS